MNITQQQKIRLNKLQKRLRREMSLAIQDYNMIEHNDVIMVCLSGGKDSYTLLDILLNLQHKAPVHFSIIAVNLDQKQPHYPEGKTTCSLCSRLRRGTLYGFAQKIGATKIALGHHRDDIIETLFLNLFYGGKMKAMPPKLLSDDKTNIIIRPLSYSREKDIQEYSQLKAFPIIPCNLCGSQENLKRKMIKDMLQGWDKQFPGRIESIFSALQNTSPSQMVDLKQFNFSELKTEKTTTHQGETFEAYLPAFDFIDNKINHFSGKNVNLDTLNVKNIT